MKDNLNNADILDLGKFLTPNGEKIRAIREKDFEIPQSNIEKYFVREKICHKSKDGKLKSNVSLRTYQRIEKGENEINRKFLSYVARLFTRLYKSKKNEDRHISLNDLILDSKIKKDPKNFDIYLNRINSFEDLSEALNLTSSKYTKSFFNCNIDSPKQISIENLFSDIEKVNSNFKKQNNPSDEIGFQKDLELLKLSTNINNNFNFLKSNKICLYMGVLKNVPVVDVDVISTDKSVDPYDGVEILSRINSQAELRDYLIFNFTECNNGLSIDMNFKSDWTLKHLESFLKQNPYVNEFTNKVSYHEWYEYGAGYPGIEVTKKAINFYASKKINLPWTLRKNQFSFKSSEEDSKMIFEDYDEFMQEAREAVEEEKLQEGEDLYAQMMADELRGK